MYTELFDLIGYHFYDLSLLIQAFNHPGSVHTKTQKSYQRLEFLGDSVLNMVISELLVRHFLEESEGDLAKRKAQAVCGETLASIARNIGIQKYVHVSAAESRLQIQQHSRILEDVLEALIGAIYLDGGLEAAKNFVIKYWEKDIYQHIKPPVDPKTFLQEWSQNKQLGIPKYVVVDKAGTDHNPEFTVEVQIKGMPSYRFTAHSKKEAEKGVAQSMIDHINKKA